MVRFDRSKGAESARLLLDVLASAPGDAVDGGDAVALVAVMAAAAAAAAVEAVVVEAAAAGAGGAGADEVVAAGPSRLDVSHGTTNAPAWKEVKSGKTYPS